MDFSINKLQQTKNNINFKGVEGAYNIKGEQTYTFYPHAHNENEEVYLELFYLKEDKNTRNAQTPSSMPDHTLKFENDKPIAISQKALKSKSSYGIGYRFKFVDKKTNATRYTNDAFRNIKNASGDVINIIEHNVNAYGISPKGGTTYHGFLDTLGVLDKNSKLAKKDPNFVRNHFNKLSGNIKGLIYLLKNSNEFDSYRYIMTNPDIGKDKVSSHKYWPSNQYQCSDVNDFKELNFELFKQGKGYIADGAFTSQGIQSPMVQHVLKWGDKSPFYDMLKVDGRITLGILPDIIRDKDITDPYEHIGVRMVNHPKSKGYDSTKATYIQFYDDRLLSEEKQKDTKNLYFDYDVAPDDHYEITTHQDSIQPYAFEITNPYDKKYKDFGENNAKLLKSIPNYEEFLSFENFEISTKNNVAGASCWDGNVDIIKMNLSNPTNAKRNIEGYKNAREYLLGVATYWSELIQSDLILQTAFLNEKDKKEIAQKNEISSKDYDEIKSSLNSFKSIVLQENKQASDFVKEFPLQSLETGEDLSAVFAQPQFKKELLSSKISKNQTIEQFLIKTLEDTITNITPGEYKGNQEYRTYLMKLYSNEILRNIFANALLNDNQPTDSANFEKLKNVTVKSLCGTPSSVEEERMDVISKLKHGLSKQDLLALEGKLQMKTSDLSLENLKLSEAIVMHGKGGLNWRFDAAKDIGDLDAIRSGIKTFDEIWNGTDTDDGVQAFWNEFVARIKKNHPSAYIINEVTCLEEFYKWKNEDSMMAMDRKLANAYKNLTEHEKNNVYEKHVAYQSGVKFINESASTTMSEYAKGFNAFSEFIGVNPEEFKLKYEEKLQRIVEDTNPSKNGNLTELKKVMDSLMEFYQPNTAIFSHMFINNHDKPTVMHTLPLNMEIYLSENLQEIPSQEAKDQIRAFLGDGVSLRNLCPKAVAVGLAFLSAIKRSNFKENEKEALRQALIDLVEGIEPKTKRMNFKRAESFGVKPYEITIQDMFKNAGLLTGDEKADMDKILDFHSDLLNVPMKLQERLWQVMNACVGNPTMYGGMEFAQTGYETSSKNVYLANRNQILHELKNDKRYENYYSKINAVSGLYKKPGLSALRDGTPVSGDITSHGSKDFWPIYKYNTNGSQTISVVSNIGIYSKREPLFSYQQKGNISNHSIPSIPLKKGGKEILKDGTKLKRYIFDGKDYKLENKDYIVKNGAIATTTDEDIVLSDTVSTFYVV